MARDDETDDVGSELSGAGVSIFTQVSVDDEEESTRVRNIDTRERTVSCYTQNPDSDEEGRSANHAESTDERRGETVDIGIEEGEVEEVRIVEEEVEEVQIVTRAQAARRSSASRNSVRSGDLRFSVRACDTERGRKKRKSDEMEGGEEKDKDENAADTYASATRNMNLGPFDADFRDAFRYWVADLGRVFTSLSYNVVRVAREEMREVKEEVSDWEIADWKSGWALRPKQREEIYVSPKDARFPLDMITALVDVAARTNASGPSQLNVHDSGCTYRIIEWAIGRLLVQYASKNRLPSTTDVTVLAQKIIDAGGDAITFQVFHERTHLVFRRQHKSAHSVEYRVPTAHDLVRQSARLRRLLFGNKDVTPKIAVGIDKQGPYMVVLDSTLFLVRYFPQVALKIHPEKYELHQMAIPMPFRFRPLYSLR